MTLALLCVFSPMLPQRARALEDGFLIRGLYEAPGGRLPYLLFMPPESRPASPLVVLLHGCLQEASDLARSTRMNRVAAEAGFFVLYPEQILERNGIRCWNWFQPEHQRRGLGEPALIAGLVRAIVRQHALDDRRIYVAGLSAGAAMAVILGVTYPDLFAAIGAHSGFEYGAASDFFSMLKAMEFGGPDPERQGEIAFAEMGDRARIVPTIVFHGDADTIVREVNGQQVVRQWLRTNSLASRGRFRWDFASPDETRRERVPNGYTYTVRRWKDSEGQSVVEYWLVHGMGHQWSGGDPTSWSADPAGPDASRAMWRFFTTWSLPDERTAQQVMHGGAPALRRAAGRSFLDSLWQSARLKPRWGAS